MPDSPFIALVHNAALLLALVLVYDLVVSRYPLTKNPARQLAIGGVLGIMGVGIMLAPFQLVPGIVFDTRSVLLAVAGLFFGFIPTVVAMLLTAAYRLSQGGAAAWVGVGVILASGGFGLLWRQRHRTALADIGWRQLYGLGLVVHVVMLLLMLTLGWSTARGVLAAIGLPVLVIYPAATTALGLLLANQLRREKAGATLRETSVLLSMAGRLGRFGGWRVDLAEQKVYWSDEVAAIHEMPAGHSPSVAEGIGFYAPEWREKITRVFQACVQEGTPYDEEMEIITARGRRVWVRAVGEAARDGTGRITGAWGAFQDISATKQATADLQASEQRWQFALEGSGDGVWDWDVPANRVFFSRRWKEMLGYDEADIGHTLEEWSGRVHPEDLPQVMADLQPHLDGRTAAYANEHRMRCKDGSHKWILDRGLVISRDAAGRPLRVVGTHTDITSRKEAEAKLREAQSVYRSFVEQLPMPAFYKDRAGRYIMVNATFCRLKGVPAEEFLGRTASEVAAIQAAKQGPESLAIKYAAKGDEVHEQIMRTGKLVELEEEYTGADGTTTYMHVVRMPVFSADGTVVGVQGIQVDLTSRKRAEAKLAETIRILQTETEERARAVTQARTAQEEMARLLAIAEKSRRALLSVVEDHRAAEQALRESEAHYRLLFENNPMPMLVYERGSLQLLAVNEAFKVHYGYDRAGALALRLPDLYPEEEKGPITALAEKLRGHAYAGEWHHRRRDGTLITIEARSHDISFNGRDARIAVITDITERKRAETALRESEAIYHSLVEQLPAGVFRKDREGRYAFVSSWFCRLQGMQPEDFLGKTAREIAEGSPARADPSGRIAPFVSSGHDHHQQVMATGQTIELIEEYPLPDGGKQFIQVIKAPIVGSDGKPIGSLGILIDITASKHAEAALRESEYMLREAQNIASMGSFVLDLPTGRWRSSPVLDRVFGIDPAYDRSVTGWLDLIHPEDRARMSDYLKDEVVGRKRPFDKEYRIIRHSDRAERWVWGLGKLDFDAQDRPLHLRGTLQDITERRQMEAALRESEGRFRALFESSLDGIMLTQTTGEILSANPTACAMLRRTEAEICALGRMGLVDLQDPRLLPLLEERRRTGKARGELTFLRGDGTRFEAEISSATFNTGTAQRNGIVFRDITERQKVRRELERFNTELEQMVGQRTEELAARNQQIQALLNAIPDTVMVLDAHGTIRHSQRAHGSPALAAITPAEGAPPPAGAPAELLASSLGLGRRALADQVTVTGETEIATPGGSLAIELQTAPTGSEEFVVFARDITARKRLEAETAAMLEKEHQVAEMRTRFISVISHEFRTPLTAIMGSVELLANHLDHLSPEKRTEIFERINRSQLRMTEMLDDVLTLNRADANRTEVRLAPVNLGPYVQNIIHEVQAGDQGAHPFAVHLPGPDTRFVTDPNLFHHIISNLLGNAVRYSPAGTTVTVRADLDAWRMHLSVEDQGIGIPPADRTRIFEAFERGSNVGYIKGTGLGLNIVKRMTDLLGGAITLRSLAGGGTRFTLSLPLQPPPAP